MKKINKIRNTDVTIDAPSSKAHTLRALIISSLAKGQTTIHKPLFGQDQLNVIESLTRLGIKIDQQQNKIIVNGCGGRYTPIQEELNVGESGVGMNFLTSAACLSENPIVLTGAKRITERPIAEVVKGLRQLGCEIDYLKNDGFPPIKIHGGQIKGGTAEIAGSINSQYFSSIVIAAPYAQTDVTVKCIDKMTEKPYVDITLQMMADFGIQAHNENYEKITIPRGTYNPREITIEGDYSSASFFFLAAAVCRSKVTVTGLNPDTKQGDGEFVDLMAKMGCDITRSGDCITIEGKKLSAITQDMSNLPDLVPPLAIAAAFAEGTTKLTNIGHLRHKECDRLAVMAEELTKMGVTADCDDDSLAIQGTQNAHGAIIDPHNDHRIAMSFAIAGLVTGDQAIEDEICVAKSFPDFWERFEIFA